MANAEAHAQLVVVGSAPDPKKLEAARKLEEEKKQHEAEATAAARKQEQEQKRLEALRLEEERRAILAVQSYSLNCRRLLFPSQLAKSG